MKKLLSFTFLSFVLSACGPATYKLYTGPEQKPGNLALYSLWNYTAFFGNLQIYTISVNEKNFEAMGAMGNVPAPGGQVALKPGYHTVRVSFVDSKNILLPTFMKSRVFPGWYEIRFRAKPGKQYAPMFNLNRDRKKWVAEMCIAEVPQEIGLSAGLSLSRKTRKYVACAKPSISPAVDKKTWCRSWNQEKGANEVCRH